MMCDWFAGLETADKIALAGLASTICLTLVFGLTASIYARRSWLAAKLSVDLAAEYDPDRLLIEPDGDEKQYDFKLTNMTGEVARNVRLEFHPDLAVASLVELVELEDLPGGRQRLPIGDLGRGDEYRYTAAVTWAADPAALRYELLWERENNEQYRRVLAPQ